MALKNLTLSLFFVWITLFQTQAQHKRTYQIFTKDGTKSSFGEILAAGEKNQIILFGELHNNPISHWLQLELTISLYELFEEYLMLGMEMFESDNQVLINEYFSELINERSFTSEARLWNNYNTDIRPLVEFAKKKNLQLIATNIPRRYASMVNRMGFESLEQLSKQALSYIAPLPIDYDPNLPGYKAMLEMTGMPTHTGSNFPKAQAIKDATMAHFILKSKQDNTIFIHFHGAFHSRNYEGIVWYLKNAKPDIEVLTIDTIEQNQVETLEEENTGGADFIIVVHDRMTKTF